MRSRRRWPKATRCGSHVSTAAPVFDLRILRDAPRPVEHALVVGLRGGEQPVPAEVWENGCGWNPTCALRIPGSWPSGVYYCEMSADSIVAGYAIFTVREDRPGSTSPIVLQNSIATWQAYNGWGGKSLYEFNSTDGERAHTVSFARPYSQDLGRGDYGYAERPFVHWLDNERIPVEFCTDLDTHADPGLLDAYRLLLVVGHDEYWSLDQRNHVEAFVARGGNVGVFSGNTCWLQIRVSPQLDRVTCYKDAALDPYVDIDRRCVTVPWAGSPVYRPENLWTGVSWRNGGFVNFSGWYPASQGYGGYTAYHTDHWAFAGTGLADGDVFGRATTIVGYETDGALFQWNDGRPVATGADSTPTSYRILGLSPASWGHATMGIHTKGGTVFNAATVDWSHGLANDPVVATMTRNVLRRLTDEPADSGHPRARARLWSEPNPAHADVRLVWRRDVWAPATLEVYSIDGRRLVAIPVRTGIRDGWVVWDGRDDAGRRAPAGVYVVRLRESSEAAATKVVIVR